VKVTVRLVLTIVVCIVVSLALYTKGDVKTVVKFLGFEFSLETKDKAIGPKASESYSQSAASNTSPALRPLESGDGNKRPSEK
jgi:hypothetical protein